ncbi:carbohydrate ABC transporter permease [Brachybacterium hainanense]|uniref:Carbohydrate ABC transporter permease n=1 Tax=Brachybacterium hainanense TaxID=1541174 RepID=A0ABV6R8A7_9MICO
MTTDAAPGTSRTRAETRTLETAGRRRGTGWSPLWSYLYLSPFIILVALFTIYPTIASLGYAFIRWDGLSAPSGFVGLENFRTIIGDPFFWTSLRNSLWYTAVLVPVQLFIALTLALVLNQGTMRFTSVYRSMFFLPAVMSPAILAVIFRLLIASMQKDWLGDPDVVMWVIIVIGIWQTLGYNLIYFLAGLQTIPKELYEAAEVDGAGWWASLRHITLPGLRSIAIIILLMAILGSLNVFDLVMVLTGGGPYFASSVVNTYIYQLAFGNFYGGGGASSSVAQNIGLASAGSVFYGFMLLGVTVVQYVLLARIKKRGAPAIAEES